MAKPKSPWLEKRPPRNPYSEANDRPLPVVAPIASCRQAVGDLQHVVAIYILLRRGALVVLVQQKVDRSVVLVG